MINLTREEAQQPEALRLAECLTKTTFPSLLEQSQAAAELRRLHEVTERQAREIEALEKLRPHWANGYTSDSVAAQASTAALSTVWEMLEVRNQTEAVMKLRRLHEVNAELLGALKEMVEWYAARDTDNQICLALNQNPEIYEAMQALSKATGEQQ
jgi:hypothetical protein